jgi:hypothetical protein
VKGADIRVSSGRREGDAEPCRLSFGVIRMFRCPQAFLSKRVSPTKITAPINATRMEPNHAAARPDS